MERHEVANKDTIAWSIPDGQFEQPHLGVILVADLGSFAWSIS